MSTFVAQKYEIGFIDKNKNAIKQDETIDLATIEPDFTKKADVTVGYHPDTTISQTAQTFNLGIFHQVLLERVYVDPILFEEGFITEEQNREITIWNAASTQKTISAINETGTSGINLTHEAIPIVMQPQSDRIHVLTILEDGPPFQNATYEYIIDGDSFSVVVTGRRVEAFPFEPDWKNGIRFKIAFKTIVSKSPKFAEQRRGIWSNARRTIRAKFWFDNIDMQKFLHSLNTFNSKILAIPIYHEPLTITNNQVTGEKVLVFKENLAEFLNTREMTQFLIVLDEDDIENSEVKEVDSIDTTDNEITLKLAIEKTFIKSRTTIYPVMLGIIEKDTFNPDFVTGRLTEQNLTLSEFNSSEV